MTDIGELRENLRTSIRGIVKMYKLKAEAADDDPAEAGLAWAAEVGIETLRELHPQESDDPPDEVAEAEQRPERGPVVADTDTPRAISFSVIESALEYAAPEDEYAIVRSDNDFGTAETLAEANRTADEFRSQTEALSPIPHTVQVIELQEVPPDA